MQLYFNKFPTIEYSNTIVRDITRRVVFPQQLTNISTAFYPYDIQNNTRSDVIAHAYYDDTDADWLIYLVNQIIDPYYGWYLNYTEFQAYINTKYGNLVDPQQRIIHWMTNWADDIQQNVTTSYFNALPPAEQKYFTPVWSPNNQIIFYTRRQEDWFMNTNQIWSMNVANSSLFEVGDLVISITNVTPVNEQMYPFIGVPLLAEKKGWAVGFIEGQAEVISSSNNVVYIKNVANNFSNGSSLTQMTNNFISTLISNVQIQVINIPLSEQVYWEPVTYFQHEQILNEKNKSLLLVDNQYLNDASTALQKNLNE